MPSEVVFRDMFSPEKLQEIYDKYIRFSFASGLDNINQKAFKKVAEEQIGIASRKVIAGNYQFTNYKLKLISKGRGKVPREISIPTIRDRIVLRATCDLLSKNFADQISLKIPQNIIKEIKLVEKQYESFIKLDVSNFYPSISHEYLNKRLKSKIRHTKTLSLINRAIKTNSLANTSEVKTKLLHGVPQGLSISNILAAIYISKLDQSIAQNGLFAYFRYVDDILILCNAEDPRLLAENIRTKFEKVAALHIHSLDNENAKSQAGKIDSDKFTYLGYLFEGRSLSVKEQSVEKIKHSLVSIFTSYKYSKNQNIDYLLWRLNFRITGCILDKKCKGWLFFFAEIDNESILHQLDLYVEHLIDRFSVSLNPKKFVRAFYQIKHHKYETKYIPNFDKYTFQEKKNVLSKVFHHQVDELSEDAIDFRFKKYVTREAKDLLEDIQNFS